MLKNRERINEGFALMELMVCGIILAIIATVIYGVASGHYHSRGDLISECVADGHKRYECEAQIHPDAGGWSK